MTEEEVSRFALVLKECECIRAKITQEKLAFSNGEGGGIPMAAAAPMGEEAAVPAVVDAAYPGAPLATVGPFTCLTRLTEPVI